MKRVLLSVLLCLFILPCTAQAGDPTDELKKSVDQVLTVLRNPAYKNPDTKKVQRESIIAIIKKIFDFQELSMRTVGTQWKIFSDNQKVEFAQAFEDLLAETYLGRIQAYSDEQVIYTGELQSNTGDRVEVQTKVLSKDKEIPIFYRMIKRERWMVYDVIIEGVSLIKNYRTQFQELLLKDTPDQLIVKVKQRVEELRRDNANSMGKLS